MVPQEHLSTRAFPPSKRARFVGGLEAPARKFRKSVLILMFLSRARKVNPILASGLVVAAHAVAAGPWIG